MTGTADTEAAEMKEIYGLDVVIIPTHRPMIRNDQNDLIYLNRNGKYNAIIQEIMNIRQQGVAPILIGTATIEASEILSSKLKQAGIHHEVLNAKQHEREADIIAQAGSPNAVTIATNILVVVQILSLGVTGKRNLPNLKILPLKMKRV